MTMRITVLGLAALLAASPLAAADLSELPGWMSGAWEQAGSDGGWSDEFWSSPRGGIMIGAARIGRDDRVMVFEHMRIIQKDDGTLVFFAQPFGRPAAEFPMVDRGNATIEDASDRYALIAVQGPSAAALMSRAAENDPTARAYYAFVETRV